MVGYALHANPDPVHIPCHRVVNREGRVSDAFAFGGGNRQIELLEAEGVELKDGYVDMKRFQWEHPVLNEVFSSLEPPRGLSERKRV